MFFYIQVVTFNDDVLNAVTKSTVATFTNSNYTNKNNCTDIMVHLKG